MLFTEAPIHETNDGSHQALRFLWKTRSSFGEKMNFIDAAITYERWR